VNGWAPVRTREDRAFRLVSVLVFAAALSDVRVSRAAEWSAEPSLGLTSSYNDNIQFTSEPHSSVWGLQLQPDVKFNGQTETLKVTGEVSATVNRYFGESGLDTIDHKVSVRSDYVAERDTLGLIVDLLRDSTLVSELATTGVVLARRQRNTYSAYPTWTRAINETTSIRASYNFSRVRYDNASNTGLVDYVDQSLAMGVQHKLDDRRSLGVTAYYDRYETDAPSSRANTFGFQVGYDHRFTETLHGSLTVGLRKTRTDVAILDLRCETLVVAGLCSGPVIAITAAESQQSSGYTLDALLEKRWETSTASVGISREINPSGIGSLVQTDRIQLTWLRQISPTFTASFAAAAYESRFIGGAPSSTESNYYRIEPHLTWRLSEELTMDASYSFAQQKYRGAGTPAQANLIYLSVQYAWPKISASR